MKQADRDQTVFLNMEQPRPDPGLPSSFRPVATSDANRARSSIPYVAQQTSVSNYSSGLNPLVNAASARRTGNSPSGIRRMQIRPPATKISNTSALVLKRKYEPLKAAPWLLPISSRRRS